ncbi:hypothetical protein HGRIS_007645 [Hohenbuehelia grisea]|uniref:Uncharacterized protein n=1 Tax=Hohenbuehelia grisea TaxID=104357 RepID=A0ABR3J5V1_9AGAR
MLKRQRPSSPSHSAPEPPLLSDPHPFDLPHREMKRRRTVPPVLDGPSRGWGPEGDTNSSSDESYDEEDFEDVEDIGARVWRGNERSAGPVVHSPGHDCSEYKAANSVLYELHALHQHRLLFASTQSAGPVNQAKPFGSPAYHASATPQSFSKDGFASPSSENLRAQSASASGAGYGHVKATSGSLDGLASHTVPELESVKQRYEDTNRLLGSLFLSRMRDRQ